MDHVTTIGSSTTLLCVFVIALALMAAVALLAAHFLPTGVNPLDEPLSAYGAGKHKNLYRAAAFWLGLAALLLAAALADAIFPKPTLTILGLLVFAAVRWSMTIFTGGQTEDLAENAPSSGAHLALAMLAYAAIAIAAGTFYPTIKDDPFWSPHATLLSALGGAVVVGAIASGAAQRLALPHWSGLVERLLYVAMIAWILVVAAIIATA